MISSGPLGHITSSSVFPWMALSLIRNVSRVSTKFDHSLGTVPVIDVDFSDRVVKLDKAPISDIRGPEIPLLPRLSVCKSVKSPISVGILPVRRLSVKKSEFSLVIQPISDGMGPVILFKYKFNRMAFPKRVRTCDGIEPDSWFWFRLMLEILSGRLSNRSLRVPFKRLLVRSRDSMMPSLLNGGASPVSWLLFRCKS